MTEMLGQYTHNLDQKNRLAIPAKLREALGESFVLCMAANGDRCLFAYSLENWQILMDKLNDRPASRQLTMLQRRVHKNAEMVEPDKQGRITIPPRFMEFAGFDSAVFLLGAGKRAELWAPAQWQRMEETCDSMGDPLLIDFAF